MGHIFWEKHEIPIPREAYVNKTDGRVFTMARDSDNKRIRTVIGHATGNGNMHPNKSFKYLYPAQWSEYYGEEENVPPHCISIGLYTAFLAIAERNGAYNLIQKNFGPLYGNALMDYAMFSASERTNSTHLFADALRTQMCFSKEAFSDSWYSDLFSKHLSLDKIHQFKVDWLNQCVQNGCNKVWLCIDGSNNDCYSKSGEINEFGHAKSNKDVPIVGYIWAVDAATGRPITWFVNPGGMIDAKSFHELALFLSSSSIEIEGVIIDRGFCTQDVINLAEECGYDYICMLKANTTGAQTLFDQHAAEVRWQVNTVVEDDGVFGITDTAKIFADSTKENCIALFFDGIKATQGSIKLIKKVLGCYRSTKAALALGRKSVKIPTDMQKYLSIEEVDGQQTVLICYDQWQKDSDRKGFYAIASGSKRDAAEINHLYGFRGNSEKQFSLSKSQQGFDVTRVHSRQSIESKLAVGFITSILRTDFMIESLKLQLDANKGLQLLNRCEIKLLPNGLYAFIDNMPETLRVLLEKFDITSGVLKIVAQEYNVRLSSSMQSQIRTLPKLTDDLKPKRGRPRKVKLAFAEEMPKRKPGRPKGSKNKSTLERERLEAEAIARGEKPAAENEPKRKPGRPKGSKNKKTLERERREALAKLALEQGVQKRKPGRPKGSKNKKTLEREAKEQALKEKLLNAQNTSKRGGSRPKGSKKKSAQPD